MWRNLIHALALAVLGLAAAPAAANSPPADEAITVSDDNQLVSDYENALFANRYADALAAADKIQVEPDNKRGQALVDAMRASALLGLKREPEARRLIAEAYALAPDVPEPSATVFEGALVTDRFDIAADTLDRMIAKYPDAVRNIDYQLMMFFLRKEPTGQKQRNDDRRIALAKLGYGGDTERGAYIAEVAISRLVDRHDFAAATELLPFVKNPETIENMLILRRYSPMWPAVEKAAGPHLATVRAASAAAAERQYAASPDDHQILANYISVLRHSGRLDDAAALKAKLPQTSSAMGEADEDMGWAVNNVAYALHELGRKDEADSLLELLDDAPMQKGDWRVSMMINRLELLVQDGRFDKALPLIEATASAPGSPYADQLTRGARYCTLSQVGRAAEAANYKPDLLAHASDSPASTVDALICAGDQAGAEQLTLSNLSNPDPVARAEFEEEIVRGLQAHPFKSDDPSVWQGSWAEFRKRPAIAAAFDRLGRDIPDEFRTDTGH